MRLLIQHSEPSNVVRHSLQGRRARGERASRSRTGAWALIALVVTALLLSLALRSGGALEGIGSSAAPVAASGDAIRACPDLAIGSSSQGARAQPPDEGGEPAPPRLSAGPLGAGGLDGEQEGGLAAGPELEEDPEDGAAPIALLPASHASLELLGFTDGTLSPCSGLRPPTAPEMDVLPRPPRRPARA
jgi:hypothetical protein